MPAKILIVEDEAITLLDIRSLLEDIGFDVVSTASKCLESIQKVRDLKPDLILVDILLNDEMDGIEVVKEIKAFCDAPIIYITSYNDEKTFKRAKLTEPYGFITKPFDHNVLKVSIETALYKHELDKKLKESEARFRSVYENSFDAILLTKPDGTILAANPAAEKMFLMREEEIIKSGRGGLVIPDENLTQAIKERAEKGGFRSELTFKRKDGSIFLGEVTSNTFTDVDSIVKTSMIIRDITERKKAEEHFHKEVKREHFLLDLYKKAPQLTDKELYNCVLDYAVSLTDSAIGFFHIISHDQKTIILNTWNNEALRTCKTSFKTHYPIGQAGNWTDCIKAKGPIVYNDFKHSPNRKGFPNGHVPVKRFISIPVFDEDKIKFIFGVGNKVEEYDDHDVIQIQSVANELYRITKQRHWEQALKEARNNLEKKVEKRTQELEKAYTTLKESEGKFREVFNQAIDMITLSEVQDKLPGRFIEVNDVSIKQLGYTREEFLNKTPLDLFAPDNRNEIPKIITELQKNGHATFETNNLAKDGRQIPMEVNVHIFKLGEKEVALSIGRDITERKKAEEALRDSELKFRKLFNQATDMLSLTELNDEGTINKYIEVNKAAYKRLGYTKDELLNMSPLDIYLDTSTLFKMMPVMFENGFSIAENVQIAKDGRHIPVELNTTLFKLGGKNIVLSISRDITKRKEREQQLNEIIKELERSNEELQSFAYITSHDLQEPLRTIASFAQLIERRYKGKLDPDADEFIEFMVDGASRMKEMILGLLDYSRVGTRGHEFTDFEAETALKYALSNLGSAISEVNAEITYDPLPIIFADRDQIIRVFQNLVGNAIKFRREGVQPEIHISAQKKGNEYIFSVRDNGIGLEEQYSDKIFEVFKRLHSIGEYQGAGIGLAVVKRIIDRHGGRIWVESELGKGSTFYFVIPNS
ncbi:PAS domain S-box protein [Methanobacterium sp.]|uniref:PAS domain S-box protein n=1 Tax=Methanobacterium sp. TaxID=2164 RepID=UPI003C78CED1